MRGVVVAVVVLAVVGAWIVLAGDDAASDDALVVAPRRVVESSEVGAAPLVVAEASAAPVPLERSKAPRADATPRERPPGFLVIDAATRERITRGTILATTRNAAWQLGELGRGRLGPPDGYDRSIVQGSTFPARLALGPRQKVLWVTAPGYAWTTYVRGRDGDVVELEPAGRLVVDFAPTEDACAQEQFTVGLLRDGRTYRTDGASGTSDARLKDSLHYGRLPAGRYEFEVHAAGTRKSGVLLHRATLDVAAHRATTHVAALAGQAASRLELIVVGAPGSSPPKSHLVNLRDERGEFVDAVRVEHAASDGDVSRFVASCLAPGPRTAQVQALGLSRAIVLPPGATTTLTVDTTDFATITARLADCREPPQVALVSWGFVDDPNTRFSEFVTSDPATKTWSVPPRPTWIHATGMTAASDTTVVSPMPGEALDVDLTCSPALAATAVVHYRWAADAPRPQSSDFATLVRTEAIGHGGRLRFISQTDHSDDEATVVTYVFDAPGRYALTLPSTWDDTRTVEIEAGPGEREPIVIDLG